MTSLPQIFNFKSSQLEQFHSTVGISDFIGMPPVGAPKVIR